MSDRLLVVSYFTPDTHYERHALRLRRSLERFGIDHRIEPRPARASWVENCAQKTTFVRQMRRESERPILWIDADAVVTRPLDIFADLDADFAVVKREGWSFYGGQIYFGASEAARDLVERWAFYSERHPHIWDQVTLGYAWWDGALEKRLRSLWLPETLSAKLTRNRVLALAQPLWTRAAILHHQESRRSKRRQSRPAAEFGNAHLPRWWCEAAARDLPFRLQKSQRSELGLG